MGWITKRYLRTSHGLSHGHTRSEKDKAPLRKIVEILRPADGLFDQDKVLLECGHTVKSNGIHRARCLQCKNSNP